MIRDFLILNFTGRDKDDAIGLRINNKFFIKRLQTNIKKNDSIVDLIFKFTKQKGAILDNNFSVLVNVGPGRFSTIRISLAIGKGIQISKGIKLYGYKNADLNHLNTRNIELLVKKKLFEKSLIKPIYIS